MSIKEAIVLSCQHFIECQHVGSGPQKLLETFAAEELGLKGDDCTEFAIDKLVGTTASRWKDGNEFNRFYTWYYINYVAAPARWKPKT